jgi:hypothetical protein
MGWKWLEAPFAGVEDEPITSPPIIASQSAAEITTTKKATRPGGHFLMAAEEWETPVF